MSFGGAMYEMLEEMSAAVVRANGGPSQMTGRVTLWMSEEAFDMHYQGAFGRCRIETTTPLLREREIFQAVSSGLVHVKSAADLVGENMRLEFDVPCRDDGAQSRIQKMIEDLHNAAIVAFGGNGKIVLEMSGPALKTYNTQVMEGGFLLLPKGCEVDPRFGSMINLNSAADLEGDAMRFRFDVGLLDRWETLYKSGPVPPEAP